MSTLYQMTAQAQFLYDLLENGEIDAQTLADTLESIGANEKLESYVYIQKQLESDLAALKGEKDRLKRKMETINKNIEKMKSAVLIYMQTAGLKKAKAGTFNLSIGTSEKVHVVDENKIPIDFLLEQRPKIDIASLRKFLKSGGKAPGAVLEQTEYVRAR